MNKTNIHTHIKGEVLNRGKSVQRYYPGQQVDDLKEDNKLIDTFIFDCIFNMTKQYFRRFGNIYKIIYDL